jgi:hypothetical protein
MELGATTDKPTEPSTQDASSEAPATPKLHEWLQTASPATHRIEGLSLNGKRIWEPGMSDEESSRLMHEESQKVLAEIRAKRAADRSATPAKPE